MNNIAMVGSGSTLSVSFNTGTPTSNMIYGYLADENYFAGCGGGGGSGVNPGGPTNPILPYNGTALNDSLLMGKRIYFIEDNSKIVETDINGSVTNVMYETTKWINKLHLDQTNQDLYWVEAAQSYLSTSGASTAIIKKSNLLNFSPSIVIIVPAEASQIAELWYSNSTSLVYWSVAASHNQSKIFNNANNQVNIEFDPPGVLQCKDFCFVPTTGNFYWVEGNDIYIGTNPTPIATLPNEIAKMVYDANTNSIIIAVNHYGWNIKSLDLATNTITHIIGEDDGFTSLYEINDGPTGLAIYDDNGTTKIFWTHLGGTIQKVDFNGSNYEIFLAPEKTPYSVVCDN